MAGMNLLRGLMPGHWTRRGGTSSFINSNCAVKSPSSRKVVRPSGEPNLAGVRRSHVVSRVSNRDWKNKPRNMDRPPSKLNRTHVCQSKPNQSRCTIHNENSDQSQKNKICTTNSHCHNNLVAERADSAFGRRCFEGHILAPLWASLSPLIIKTFP